MPDKQRQAEDLPPLLSLTAAAAILDPDCNPRSVYSQVDRGTFPLPIVRYGRRMKVRKADLLRLLEGDAA